MLEFGAATCRRFPSASRPHRDSPQTRAARRPQASGPAPTSPARSQRPRAGRLDSLAVWRNDERAMKALLYTRAGCHLCDDAHLLLLRHGLTVETVDIDGDAELRERYDQCVPVVWIDGRERFRGRVSEILLKRILARANDE